MASGTISGGNYNSIYSYYMTWSSVSNGSVANTSNVTLNWVYKKNASDPYGAYNTNGSSKVTLTINGTSSGSMRADFDLRSAATGTTKVIATFTLNNIPHNSDGTCTINVSGSHTTGVSWGTKSIGSTSITLDTIPRYATCSQTLSDSTETSLTVNWSSDSTIDYVWYSIDNGSNWTAVGSVNTTQSSYTIPNLSANTTYNVKTRVRRKDSQLTTDSAVGGWGTLAYPYISSLGSSALTIGNSQTLYLYNPKGRTITVYMKKDSTSGSQIYSGTTSNNSNSPFTFTPTASTMYNLIKNSKSGNCVYYVVYSGNTSATKSGTFVVNESSNKPTVTSSSAYDNNDTTYDLTRNRNKIVLNGSNMALTINANAKNNATFNNNGYIKVNGTALTLTISGSNASGVYNLNKPSSSSYTVELKDSRGIVTQETVTLSSYVSYFEPTILSYAARNQPTDNKLNISGNGSYFNGSFGNKSNTITATYTITEKSGGTVLETGSMTSTSTGNNYSLAQKQISNVNYTKEYIATITVTDKLNSVSTNKAVPKGQPVFWWNDSDFNLGSNNLLVNNVNFKNFTFVGSTGANLNSDAYSRPGFYSVTASGSSSTPTFPPESTSGYLLVLKDVNVYNNAVAQFFFGKASHRIYYRYKTSTTWSNWYRLLTNEPKYADYQNTSIKQGTLQVWKRGTTVQFVCEGDVGVNSNLSTGETYYTTIGYDYRPFQTVCFSSWNNKSYVFLKIDTDGKVYLGNYAGTITSATNFAVEGCYLTDNLL